MCNVGVSDAFVLPAESGESEMVRSEQGTYSGEELLLPSIEQYDPASE